MSDDELYAVTRYAWNVAPNSHKARFAFAVFKGVILEVYAMEDWRKATPPKGENWKTDRWEFDGVPADEEVRSKYIGRRVEFRRGAANPITYVNC